VLQAAAAAAAASKRIIFIEQRIFIFFLHFFSHLFCFFSLLLHVYSDAYDNIPVEVSGANAPEPITEYTEATIGPDLLRNTRLCGYSRPTPVQKYSCPIGAAGRDLMACAQTGSGKTAGFLFPVIISMIKLGGAKEPENSRNAQRYVLMNRLMLLSLLLFSLD
jgi:hypothetical protein